VRSADRFREFSFFSVPDRPRPAILKGMETSTNRETDPPDEQARLKRAVAGDQAAWAAILAPYRDRLRRMVALRMDHRLKGRIDPSDVLQEAFLQAAHGLPKYMEQAGVARHPPWVARHPPFGGAARRPPFGGGNSNCRQSLGVWVARHPPFGGAARRPPFGGGNSNCRQSLGVWGSVGVWVSGTPECGCLGPRSVGVWDPECGCLGPSGTPAATEVGVLVRSVSTPRRRWVSWSALCPLLVPPLEGISVGVVSCRVRPVLDVQVGDGGEVAIHRDDGGVPEGPGDGGDHNVVLPHRTADCLQLECEPAVLERCGGIDEPKFPHVQRLAES
jgi:hypothetical protein